MALNVPDPLQEHENGVEVCREGRGSSHDKALQKGNEVEVGLAQ